MSRKSSPLALKRGPKVYSNATLRRKLVELRAKRKKRKYALPTSRLWPGQIEAMIEALKSCLWNDPSHEGRKLVYPADHEKIVRAVWVAGVMTGPQRVKKKVRRVDKGEGGRAERAMSKAAGSQDTQTEESTQHAQS